ncbi:MAG: hypothetical protein AAF570_02535 [Bacteroidota bacterium]
MKVTDIVAFIQSLSTGERREFRKSLNKKSGFAYASLFDAVPKSGEVDRAGLAAKVGVSPKVVGQRMDYLFRMLIDRLSVGGNEDPLSLMRWADEIAGRELFDFARRLYMKSYQAAEMAGNNELQFQVVDRLKHIAFDSEQVEEVEDLLSIVEHRIEIAEGFRKVTELISNGLPDDPNEYTEALLTLLDQLNEAEDRIKDMGLSNLITTYRLRREISLGLGKWKMAVGFAEKTLEFSQGNEAYRTQNMHRVIRDQFRLAISNKMGGSWEKYQQAAKALKELPCPSRMFESTVKQYYAFLRVDEAMESGNEEMVAEALDIVKEIFAVHGGYLRRSIVHHLRFSVVRLLFATGKYAECLKWITGSLEMGDIAEVGKDIEGGLMLYRLYCWCETGDWEKNFEAAIQATRRRLHTNQMPSALGGLSIHVVSQYMRKGKLQAEELNGWADIAVALSTPLQGRMFIHHGFNLALYLRSKATGKNMLEMLRDSSGADDIQQIAVKFFSGFFVLA